VKSSGGAAFPPMSATAPTPFGGFSKKDESKPAVKSSGLATLPPMSAAAPTPFGGFSKKDEIKPAVKSSGGAAFPPMAVAAPKVFGASSKKEDKPSGGAAFPPMSATAPSPFGAFSKKDESKPAVKSSSGAAFPPMSAAAPKPFGGFSKKDEKKPAEKSSSGAAFPPMSAAAPQPHGSAAFKQKQSDLSFSVSSRYEAELWDQVNRFSVMTSNAKKLRHEAASCIASDMGNDIETMVNKYQGKLSDAELSKDNNTAIVKRLRHLFSVQDDLDRQKKESNLAIKEQNTNQASSLNLARKEPLDAESEKMRRSLVSKCHRVQNLMYTVESRLALNKEIFSCTAGNQQDTLRASDYFNQWSRSEPIGRQQTAKGATNAMFKSLTSGYDRVRNFDSFVKHLSEKSSSLSKSHESNGRELHRSGVKRAKNKSRLGSSISPRPTSHLISPLRSRIKPSDVRSSILERQKALRGMRNELAGAVSDFSSKTFYLRGQLVTRDSSSSQTMIPDWRSKGRNELFSNSKAQQTSLVTKSLAASPVVKTLFSSPTTGMKARSEWNTSSELEKALLRVNIPQKLKQVEASDAAKKALAKFGTTPEKLAEGREVVRLDATESKTPLKSPSDKRVILSKYALSGENAASANATFPGLSSKSTTTNLSKSNVAAFPPIPTRSPKPLSQSLNLNVPTPPPKPASAPSTSGIHVDYKCLLTKFFEENSPGKAREVDAYLQKYKGKEADLFVGLAKKYDKPNALNEVFESRVKGIDQNDYLALISLYLQVFNPARAEVAEKLLSKNKGKEADMFAEYSEKWRTCNPLEKPKSAKLTTKPQNLFAAREPTTSAPAPSPFAPEVKSNQTSSAPAPSPFGEVKSTVTSGSSDVGATEINYHKLLTEFYQKHNPQKVPEVANTLSKYKGKESEMFSKLAQKYKTSNPLDMKAAPSSGSMSFGFGSMGASLGASKSPFGGEKKSPFGSPPADSSGAPVSTTTSATTAPTSNTPAFGGGANKSPFGATSAAPAPANSPFNSTSSSAFGTGFGTTSNPFGGSSGGSAFGGAAPTPATPFSSSAFGSTPTTSGSPFGQAPAPPPTATVGSNPSSKFGGRNPRDILVSFYQSKNPSKINDVDKVLMKYAGKEEQLFINLAKKYNLDPSMFGVSAPLAPSAPSFGSPGTMGMGSNAGFGGGGSAFGGASSTFGSSFASASQGGGFGSLASTSPAGGGFGGFGGSASGGAPSFGAPAFGAARR